MDSNTLNQLLPQTQCRECGFSGCLPYAQAMAKGEAAINLCAPGGEAVIRDLAQMLSLPEMAPAKTHQQAIAWIDEAVCIGCTACIRACPVDAIMGASKLMHTVLADECTGCGLCVAPCPVDCIYMQSVEDDYLPRARFLAEETQPERFAAATHARLRYEAHEARLAKQKQVRQQHLLACEQAVKAGASGSVGCGETTQSAPSAPSALNAAALIAQAIARAQAQQNDLVVPANREHFREAQIKEAQERALFRRYQNEARYGDEAQKAAAIEWLRRYKEEQVAKEAAK